MGTRENCSSRIIGAAMGTENQAIPGGRSSEIFGAATKRESQGILGGCSSEIIGAAAERESPTRTGRSITKSS